MTGPQIRARGPKVDFTEAPCASSDDPDAWFVNKNGRLEPEEREEIIAKWEQDARRSTIGLDLTIDDLDEALEQAKTAAELEIAELEQANRVRLRMAMRTCYFDCPMALRLACLNSALVTKDMWGVRGGYSREERIAMIKVAEEHQMTGQRVAEIAISADRAAALGGGQPDDDQSAGGLQPLTPEAGADTTGVTDNNTEEGPWTSQKR